MLRWIVLLLAVVGLVTGLFVALGAEGASPAGVRSDLEPIVPGDVSPTPLTGDGGSGWREDPNGPELANPNDPEGRQDAFVEGASGFLPIVIVREDGGAVPRARVTFLDRTRTEGWAEIWEDDRQRDAFIRRHGETEFANDRGHLTVRSTRSGVLVGESGGLVGLLEWSEPVLEKPLKLVLRPEVDLRVQVVDQRGRPKPNVRVSIVREVRGTSMTLLTRSTTGTEAIANFARVRRVIGGRPDPLARHFVTLGFPCDDPPRIPLDPMAVPTEVLVLDLPAVGSIEVLVVDDRGVPMQEVANATLGVMIPAAGGERVFRAEHNERLIGGKAIFTYIGVGTEVAIKLSGSRDRPDLIEEHVGPARRGEVKRVTVRWVDRHPVLLGVAVSETGEVLKVRRGRYMVWSGAGGSGGPPLVTGPDGSFRVVVASSLEAAPGRRAELELYSRDGGRPLEAVLDLSGPLSSGESDLGHVVFSPKPELVTGTIRNPAGEGITGVHVRVLTEPDHESGRRTATYSATTVKDGVFTIHGRIDGNFQIVAVRRGFGTLRVDDVVPGTKGLELTMTPDLPTVPGGGR